MGLVAFNFQDRSKQPVQLLKDAIQAGGDDARKLFAWLADILDTTLDDELLHDLRSSPVESTGLDPLQIDEHLQEASRLLDASLVQRKEIHQLESQAVLTALDAFHASQAARDDLAVERVKLQAAAKQAQVDDGPGLDALEKKAAQTRDALETRIRLHNRSGSALNYGERVRFMRRMYLSNVRRALERLHAAWRGTALAYGVSRADPRTYVDALPQGEVNLLNAFVAWLRNCLAEIERIEAVQNTYVVYLYLCEENIAPGLKARLAENRGGTFQGEFTLEPKHIAQFPQLPADIGRTRIVGMDLAFRGPVIDDESFKVSLRVPKQSVTLGGVLHEWQPGMFRSASVPTWATGSARERLVPNAHAAVSNASPYGKWQLWIDEDVRGRMDRHKFGEWKPGSPNIGGMPPKPRIDDLVLALQVISVPGAR